MHYLMRWVILIFKMQFEEKNEENEENKENGNKIYYHRELRMELFTAHYKSKQQ